tara:strand:+ start:295 stop:516 length:222 start_codon:yes stop_codon:yes gene_type:complete
MKEQVKVLDQLLWLIDLQTQKVKLTHKVILSFSKALSDEKLYHILEIQENALERLKIRYNKHAYKLELFKIKT